MLLRSENDVADAISRGAPPFERLQSPGFRSIDGAQKQGEAIAKQWIDNIFGSYRQDERFLLRASGLDNSHRAKAFGAARLDQNATLPDWGANVVMLLRMLPDSLPNSRSDAEPTILLAEGLLGPASAFLGRALRDLFISHSGRPLLTEDAFGEPDLDCQLVDLRTRKCAPGAARMGFRGAGMA